MYFAKQIPSNFLLTGPYCWSNDWKGFILCTWSSSWERLCIHLSRWNNTPVALSRFSRSQRFGSYRIDEIQYLKNELVSIEILGWTFKSCSWLCISNMSWTKTETWSWMQCNCWIFSKWSIVYTFWFISNDINYRTYYWSTKCYHCWFVDWKKNLRIFLFDISNE